VITPLPQLPAAQDSFSTEPQYTVGGHHEERQLTEEASLSLPLSEQEGCGRRVKNGTDEESRAKQSPVSAFSPLWLRV